MKDDKSAAGVRHRPEVLQLRAGSVAMGSRRPALFRKRQFDPAVIAICVRWYLFVPKGSSPPYQNRSLFSPFNVTTEAPICTSDC